MSQKNGPETTWVQENVTYDNERKFNRNVSVKSIVYNKTVRGWIFLTLFAFIVPVLVYYYTIDQGTFKTNDSYTCLVQPGFRVSCGEVNITSSNCKKVQCCYDKSTQTCYHYLPSKYSYDTDVETNQYTATQSKTPYDTDSLGKLRVSINERDENRVSIILSQENVTVEEHFIEAAKNYSVKLIEEKLMVEIHRNSGELLLSTTKGPLIASANYWEWSIYLTNHTLFGLNQTFINVPTNETFTKVFYKNKVDHSTFPVLWAYNNKKFHSVVIKHEGPLEITILPSNLVVLKSLTGTLLELEVAVGPTPKLLHDQNIVKAYLPPSWVLQTHICKRGSNVNLTELMQDYSLEIEGTSDCIHENLVMAIMNDNGQNTQVIRDTISTLKEQGNRFLLSVPPHVLQKSELYNKSVELGILFNYNSSIYTGRYLEQIVAYPDYNHTNSQNYLTEFFNLLSTYVDLADINGYVLHDNWPMNENYTMNSTDFPYLPKDFREAMSYTLPWNSTANNGSLKHIQNHNTYGANQILSFENYFQNNNQNDVFIMSASKTFDQTPPSVIQNINITWTDLQMQIDNVIFSSISGQHLVNFPISDDVIFFSSSLQEVLCLRWYLVAATMPMFRVSSYMPWRDFRYVNATFAQDAALKALTYRKLLLPYYYTLLSRNEPIVRPMFYDYYEDEAMFSLINQYMIGDAMLVAHPFSTGRNKLQIYLPSSIGIWYEMWGGQLYNVTKESWISFDIVETDFISFLRQGSILPLKDDNKMSLIIALNCSTTPCEASGTLFDNSYINFVSNESVLTISDLPTNCNYTLQDINLYYYENGEGIRKYFNKTEDLCNSTTSVTITLS